MLSTLVPQYLMPTDGCAQTMTACLLCLCHGLSLHAGAAILNCNRRASPKQKFGPPKTKFDAHLFCFAAPPHPSGPFL